MNTAPKDTPPVAARPAATLICVRDGAAGLEVLMTVRHQTMEFGPGALVFPGGRVEDTDRAIADAGHFCDPAAATLTAEGLAFRIAAIRETFEEAGLFLARDPASGTAIDNARLQDLVGNWRRKLLEGALSFHDFLQREGVVLQASDLVHFAHWIAPHDRPKRFNTHFFLAPAPPGQVAGHDSGEAVSVEWLAPGRAVE